MVHFVNYRLELRRADGMRAREVNDWVLGRSSIAGRHAYPRGLRHLASECAAQSRATPPQPRTDQHDGNLRRGQQTGGGGPRGAFWNLNEDKSPIQPPR